MIDVEKPGRLRPKWDQTMLFRATAAVHVFIGLCLLQFAAGVPASAVDRGGFHRQDLSSRSVMVAQNAGSTSSSEGLPPPSFHWDPKSGSLPNGNPLPGGYLHDNVHVQRSGSSIIINHHSATPASGYPSVQDASQSIESQANRQSSLESSAAGMPGYGYAREPRYSRHAHLQHAYYRRGHGHHHMRNYYPPPNWTAQDENNQYATSQANWHRQRSAALQQSAAELRRELDEPANYEKRIKLVPNGTNLYVRNYVTFHSAQDDRENVNPVIAVPKKLEDVLKPEERAHKFGTDLPHQLRGNP